MTDPASGGADAQSGPGAGGFLQVQTAVPSLEGAERIAAALVERRLAAAVQVLGPIRSTYRWRGRVETAEEWLCLAKTEHAQYAALEAAVRELHPYEVPEVLAVPVAEGSQSYLGWLAASLAPETA